EETCKGVVDAARGDIGVRVRGVQTDPVGDEVVHHPALGRVRRYGDRSGQEQRGMGDDEVRAEVDRLGDDDGINVDGEQRGAHAGVRFADGEPDRVPRLGRVLWVEFVE